MQIMMRTSRTSLPANLKDQITPSTLYVLSNRLRKLRVRFISFLYLCFFIFSLRCLLTEMSSIEMRFELGARLLIMARGSPMRSNTLLCCA